MTIVHDLDYIIANSCFFKCDHGVIAVCYDITGISTTEWSDSI